MEGQGSDWLEIRRIVTEESRNPSRKKNVMVVEEEVNVEDVMMGMESYASERDSEA